MTTPQGVTIVEWVSDELGPLVLKDASEPTPTLHDHNLIAVADSADAVRQAVLPWERIESQDKLVGFAAFGTEPVATAPPEEAERDFDPSHELRHAGGRAGVGIAGGAVVGAIVITLVAALVVGWSSVLIGVALGGAAFGAAAGAMISFATKTGWGAAYQDSFVDEHDTTLAVASIHSSDPGVIELAASSIDGVDGLRLYRVDRSGRPIS